MAGLPNAEAQRYWSALAAAWIEGEGRREAMLALPGELAMARLAPASGERVLDVGCGTGGTTLELARRAAPGEAVGIDLAAEMLAVARRRAGAAAPGGARARFVVGDAQVHDLGEAAFDAAYSRFGVMFFADPLAAFANLRRALRPGGRLALVTWQARALNDWSQIPVDAAVAVLGIDPPDDSPGHPGAFSLAEPEHVESLLEVAGFDSVVVTAHEDDVAVAESQLASAAQASLTTGWVAEALADATPAQVAQVAEAVEEAMRSRLRNGETRLRRAVLVSSGLA